MRNLREIMDRLRAEGAIRHSCGHFKPRPHSLGPGFAAEHGHMVFPDCSRLGIQSELFVDSFARGRKGLLVFILRLREEGTQSGDHADQEFHR